MGLKIQNHILNNYMALFAQQYQKLYNLIKGQYESNKGYFLSREEQEQKRILYDDNARDFVKLASILRVGF